MLHYSAKTCIKQLPAGYSIVKKYFGWEPGTVNFDIGGGKYDIMTEKLKDDKVINIIYDPYNRSFYLNTKALEFLAYHRLADTVTVFNVLNVIEDKDEQLDVIKMAFNNLKNKGIAYFRSIYKNPNGMSGFTKSGTFQHYMTHEEYSEIIKEVFPYVELKYGLIVAKKC